MVKHDSHFRNLKKALKLRRFCPEPDIIESWAAVHLIFSHDQKALKDGLKLAMIRRTQKKEDPWSGHYAFPGGRVDEGEDLLKAAFRETHEEVGLKLGQDTYLGEFLHMQLKLKGKNLPFAISAHASYIPNIMPFTPCPDEVDEAFWFSLNNIHNEAHLYERKFKLSGGEYELPCISFSGHTIWGISYMILQEIFSQWEGLPYSDNSSFSKSILPKYPYGRVQK